MWLSVAIVSYYTPELHLPWRPQFIEQLDVIILFPKQQRWRWREGRLPAPPAERSSRSLLARKLAVGSCLLSSPVTIPATRGVKWIFFSWLKHVRMDTHENDARWSSIHNMWHIFQWAYPQSFWSLLWYTLLLFFHQLNSARVLTTFFTVVRQIKKTFIFHFAQT